MALCWPLITNEIMFYSYLKTLGRDEVCQVDVAFTKAPRIYQRRPVLEADTEIASPMLRYQTIFANPRNSRKAKLDES